MGIINQINEVEKWNKRLKSSSLSFAK